MHGKPARFKRILGAFVRCGAPWFRAIVRCRTPKAYDDTEGKPLARDPASTAGLGAERPGGRGHHLVAHR